MWDWTYFYTGIAYTFGGLILGIPIGLLLNRLLLRASHKHESQVAAQRKYQVLTAFLEEVQHNSELLDQLETELNKDLVPYYSLDTNTWKMLGSEIAKTITTENVLPDISCLYFEIDHMKRKIDAIFQLITNPMMKTTTHSPLYQEIKGAVLVQIPPTKQRCIDVKSQVSAELESVKKK